MFLGDFHLHSTFSDGRLTIPQIVDLYGSLGFGAIAITDHLCETNSLMGKSAAYLGRTLTTATFPLYWNVLQSEAERAWDQYRLVVIPGVEITKNSLLNHRSAHILAVGIQKIISADGDIVDILKNIREQGAISIAAHPVFTKKMEKQTYHLWDRREELRHLVDAWEVASGQDLFPEVVDAKLPKIANSDMHRIEQIASWKNVFSGERHPQAILQAIRKQELSFRYYQAEEINDHILSPFYRDMGSFPLPHPSGHLSFASGLEKTYPQSA